MQIFTCIAGGGCIENLLLVARVCGSGDKIRGGGRESGMCKREPGR